MQPGALTADQVIVVEPPTAMELAPCEVGAGRNHLRRERKRRIRLHESITRIEIRRDRAHGQRAVAQRLIDLRRRHRGIRLQHQRGNAGHMRRRRRGAEEIRIARVVLAGVDGRIQQCRP